jgi:hypothetical protein
MPDNNLNVKQQVVERIKQSTNILITVGVNPSVDALSALLALTLLVNKLDKHGAAVFSGVVPPAINFLEPDKTFEHNVDSLRDFIIALDKEKADRLRYKVEDDVVRIFITPYKTTITEKDLQFSQGDFNVDLIIALGVEKREELDQAIVAHGRILHDATVITINTADQKSSLGSIDWHEAKASSLSEMLASIADVIKPGILDQQISTALLTGVVAATERFSNKNTTPQVMTVAAQLMAAGANQQLIASNLQGVQAIPTEAPVKLSSQESGVISNIPSSPPGDVPKPDGEMQISHEPATPPEATVLVPPPAVPKPELVLPVTPPPAKQFSDLKQAISEDNKKDFLGSGASAPGSQDVNAPAAEPTGEMPETDGDYLAGSPSWKGRTIKPIEQPLEQPAFGGSLSATTQQALEDEQLSRKADRNKKILTHNQPTDRTQVSPAPQLPSPEVEKSRTEEAEKVEVLPKQEEPSIELPQVAPYLPPPPPSPSPPSLAGPTIEQIERDMHKPEAPTVDHGADLQAARAAVDEALESIPTADEAIGSQPLPPVSPSFVPTIPPDNNAPLEPIGQLPPEIKAPAPQPTVLPPLPPMPDFSQLPPLPPSLPPLSASNASPNMPPPSPLPPPSSQLPKPQDPGQFHIPGL